MEESDDMSLEDMDVDEEDAPRDTYEFVAPIPQEKVDEPAKVTIGAENVSNGRVTNIVNASKRTFGMEIPNVTLSQVQSRKEGEKKIENHSDCRVQTASISKEENLIRPTHSSQTQVMSENSKRNDRSANGPKTMEIKFDRKDVTRPIERGEAKREERREEKGEEGKGSIRQLLQKKRMEGKTSERPHPSPSLLSFSPSPSPSPSLSSSLSRPVPPPSPSPSNTFTFDFTDMKAAPSPLSSSSPLLSSSPRRSGL